MNQHQKWELADTIAYMKKLRDHERAGGRVSIPIGPYTALIMVTAVQIAATHPMYPPAQRAQLRLIVDSLLPAFAGTMGEELIHNGWFGAGNLTAEATADLLAHTAAVIDEYAEQHDDDIESYGLAQYLLANGVLITPPQQTGPAVIDYLTETDTPNPQDAG